MKILFFSQTRNLAGCPECDWNPEGSQSADDVWAYLLQHFPQLASVRKQTRLARNGEMAGSDTRFQAGDEVALIPPVSGG